MTVKIFRRALRALEILITVILALAACRRNLCFGGGEYF